VTLLSNIAANYASQIYTTLIGIVLVPLYLQYMGPEAYGLVGFFAVLQALFSLLDLGLTPTIARESARYHGGAISAVAYRQLYRSLSIVFTCVAIIGGTALFLEATAISERWLNTHSLPAAEVRGAVQIMTICVALRWLTGLYRGVITGSERLVWLSGCNALIATLRFGGVFVTMWIWGYTPVVFFGHQLAVAALEFAMLLAMAHTLLPDIRGLAQRLGWSFRPVEPLLRFSLTIAFTSGVWVLVTQTDKLILSGILPLAQYGYFTLAVLVAGGITILTGPISTALLPRMARLYAEGRDTEVRRLYSNAAQLVSVVAGSLAVAFVVGAEHFLFAWTGSRDVTAAAAPILRLYAIGNGLLALGAFPFYLQYARGSLGYHLIGNVALVVVLIPSIIVAASRAGAIGAGWVWVAMNASYLFLWVGYVHSKLEPGLHWSWLGQNVFAILLPVLIVCLLLRLALPGVHSRFGEILYAVALAGVCLLVATFASPLLRRNVLRAIPVPARFRLGTGSDGDG
jgi:O-antigen/teichoic acid export membrane protein